MAWNSVHRRGFRHIVQKWDSFPYGRNVVDSELEIVSVYVSEFPERHRAVDLFKLFGCIGDVIEVVIPPMRNNLGKRYGFARFKNVEDARMLAVKLDNVLIDGRKIHANLPRFDRRSNRGEGGGSYV